MRLRSYLKCCLLFTVTCLLLLPTLLMAQDAPATPIETMTQEGMWQYLIAIVTPFIVGGIKKLVPKIPKVLLPVSTPFVGLVVGFGLNAIAGANLDVLTMAKMGGLAVLIRETWDQAIKPSDSQPPEAGG